VVAEITPTIAFLFPGQGSQAVGMGKGFYEMSAGAKAIFEEANDSLGFDLARLAFEGPEAELALTANTQPAVLTASVAAATACAERGLRPTLAAGHSLGEYTALVVAGAIRFSDAVRIVRKRGEFMQEAVPVGTGAMAAIMGIELAAVEKVCVDAAQGEVVEIANVNSALQIVIAGHRSAVERAVALATERGGKMSVMLPVSAPFHCSLMAPAGARLAPELDAARVTDPRVPVVRNVDAGVTRKADDVRPFLLRQVASPVRWTECVERLAAEGATAFVEVGPGRVLSGLLRRIVNGARGQSVEDPAGLEKALTAVAGGSAESRA
jgi:[acyl-carrier-protein] S-malonyltransferase